MEDVEGASLEAELAATEELVDAALRASAALVRELRKAKLVRRAARCATCAVP